MKRFIGIIAREAAPGAIAAGFAIAYTLAFNTSLSYMGNSVDNALSLVLNNFLGALLLALGKLLFSYIIVFGLLGAFFRHSILGILEWKGISPRRLTSTVLPAAVVVIFSVITLAKDLILYPQMYIDSFYLKNTFYRWIQETLTNNVHPWMISAIQIIFILIFSAGFAFRFRRFPLKAWSAVCNHRKITVAVLFSMIIIPLTIYLIPSRAQTSERNVIIIAADALRPDHMSGYGYTRQTTPSIDRLIRSGMSYRQVYTTVPRTFPSWVSMLSSSYPFEHSVRNMFPSSATRNRKLETLPSVLRDRGYHTAVVGDFAADIFPRIDLGFEQVNAPTFDAGVLMEQILIKTHNLLLPFLTNKAGFTLFGSIREFAEFADPSYVTADIKSQIRQSIREKKPFFITCFYSITHFPFSGPYPYYNLFTDRSASGPSKYLKNRIVSLGSKSGSDEITGRDIAHIRSLYDGCLRGFDDSVGDLIEFLDRNDLTKNTLIVIMSDHGENLYEYDNGMGHGEHLRSSFSLKIPFIMAGPGISHGQSSETRSSIDIAPTILSYLKIPSPASFRGKPLFSPSNQPVYMETGLWFDTSGDFFFQKLRLPYPDITGLSEIEFGYKGEIVQKRQYLNYSNIAKHRSMISGGWKLIYMPTVSGIVYELYDTINDPDERTDLADKNPQKLRDMKKLFFSFLSGDSNCIEKNGYLIPLFDDPIF